MQLRLLNHGDFCMLDEQRIGYGSTPDIVPLTAGRHSITFGLTADPYVFNIEVAET